MLSAGSALGWDRQEIARRAETLYGPRELGRQRLADWWHLVHQVRHLAVADQLREVNAFFNDSLRFEDDSQVWRRVDYWATPVEFLYQGAGDCEDQTIAKYVTLRHLGVPMEQLRLTYVKADGQAHMVLTYYAEPDTDPLVLDSLVTAVLPARQRGDLQPVYAFNGAGLWYSGAAGNRWAGNSQSLSRWQDVLRKMQREGFEVDVER